MKAYAVMIAGWLRDGLTIKRASIADDTPWKCGKDDCPFKKRGCDDRSRLL